MPNVPPLWEQVNEDGFGYPLNPAYEDAALFGFDGHLYANTEHALMRLGSPRTKRWGTVPLPVRAGASVSRPIPLGDHLYVQTKDGVHLWRLAAGAPMTQGSWTSLTSVPYANHPHLMTIFGKRLYGIRWTTDPATGAAVFEILRSDEVGPTTLTWETVVVKSFGDPVNNTGLSFMAPYAQKLYAGTMTLKGSFGAPQPATGVEIWETPSGDPGSWIQVNDDGFGTVNDSGMRTNHVIGSWAVYRAPTQIQDYLYIGTKSHWGAEIWRYNGTGSAGWKNVTQPWAGVSTGPLSTGPGRNESMAVFENLLYVAEGFPTGNLSTYDEADWKIVVPGPEPFDPMDSGVISLATLGPLLFAHTLHKPYVNCTKADQVWAYPYLFR